MNFKDYLKNKAENLNTELQNFFATWRAEVEQIDSQLLPLIDVTIDANEGGKRLRAGLVCLGYEMVSGDKENAEIYKPASAFEIFQTAILAHDDIMDKSPTRRGKPTIYKALGGDHYAISQTITLGDIGFFLATQIISEADFNGELKSKALSVFSKAMLDTAFGQLIDVSIPHKQTNGQYNLSDTEQAQKDYYMIAKHKTSRYTFVGPLQLGAILAGADNELLKKIKQFGDDLGIAFQIQDDILGVFGDEKELGKSVTSDIEEGKNTLLITEALKHANQEQQAVLNKYYGKGKIGEVELKQIQTVFEQTGSLEYSKQKALEYVNQAKKIIPEITADENYQNLLTEMADFLILRSK